MAFISGGKAIIVNLELFDDRYDNEPIVDLLIMTVTRFG